MKKWTVVLVGGLLLAGVLALFPSPAGAELKVTVSGNIRFNALWADADTGNTQTPGTGNVPITNCKALPGGVAGANLRNCNQTDDSHLRLDARRTRIQVGATDQVQGVKLLAFIQTDFDTTDGNSINSNSRHLRIRLGYAQANMPNGLMFRFGQTRSMLSEYGDNIIGGVGDPEVVDETGHFSQIDHRVPALHLAWTTKVMGGDLAVGVGAERNAVGANLGSAAVDESQGGGQTLPLFTTGVRYRNPLFGVYARYGATQINVKNTNNGGNKEDTSWLAGVAVDVTPIPPLTLVAQYWHSQNGLHRVSSSTPFTATALQGSQEPGIWSPEVTAIHAGFKYKLTKAVKVGYVYTWQNSDNDPGVRLTDARQRAAGIAGATGGAGAGAVTETFHGHTAWIVYSFWTRMDTGLEYQYIFRDTFSKQSGEVNLLTYRLRFYF